MNTMTERAYVVTLDERQFGDVTLALEVMHRLMCGQVEVLREFIPGHVTRGTLARLKYEAFPELAYEESYSWNGGHPDAEVDRMQAALYQLYREMRHVDTVSRQGDGRSVYEHPTLETSKARRPLVHVINP